MNIQLKDKNRSTPQTMPHVPSTTNDAQLPKMQNYGEPPPTLPDDSTTQRRVAFATKDAPPVDRETREPDVPRREEKKEEKNLKRKHDAPSSSTSSSSSSSSSSSGSESESKTDSPSQSSSSSSPSSSPSSSSDDDSELSEKETARKATRHHHSKTKDRHGRHHHTPRSIDSTETSSNASDSGSTTTDAQNSSEDISSSSEDSKKKEKSIITSKTVLKNMDFLVSLAAPKGRKIIKGATDQQVKTLRKVMAHVRDGNVPLKKRFLRKNFGNKEKLRKALHKLCKKGRNSRYLTKKLDNPLKKGKAPLRWVVQLAAMQIAQTCLEKIKKKRT